MDVKMKQISLEYEPLLLTTKHPFGISYGSKATTENILVKLKYGEHIGYGESSPASYHDETKETVMALFKQWSQGDILGDSPFEIQAVMNRLDKFISGNRSAKAAIEMALYDLVGKLLNRPVIDLFGLRGLPTPITDFTIGIDSLEIVEKKTKEALSQGYRHLKVKQGTDNDKEIIRTIRSVSNEIPIRVDANGAWTPKQAIEMSKFLAKHKVEFIEQPIPKNSSVEDWKITREGSRLPIYADESICVASDVARLAGTIDGVVVKLMKTGGLLEAIRVISTARAHSLKVMIGCMIESSIGISAACQIAPLVDHLDLDGALLLSDDPFQGAYYDDGIMRLADLPGLSVVPR